MPPRLTAAERAALYESTDDEPDAPSRCEHPRVLVDGSPKKLTYTCRVCHSPLVHDRKTGELVAKVE